MIWKASINSGDFEEFEADSAGDAAVMAEEAWKAAWPHERRGVISMHVYRAERIRIPYQVKGGVTEL